MFIFIGVLLILESMVFLIIVIKTFIFCETVGFVVVHPIREGWG